MLEKVKIFLSSVQSEFAEERKALASYIDADALLGKHFEVFLFEQLPALALSAQETYIKQVIQCDIYIGLVGTKYGTITDNNLSPTEIEYNVASEHHKTKLIFLSQVDHNAIEKPQKRFIKKIENDVVRKKFDSLISLKVSVYNALIRYLEDKEEYIIYQ